MHKERSIWQSRAYKETPLIESSMKIMKTSNWWRISLNNSVQNHTHRDTHVWHSATNGHFNTFLWVRLIYQSFMMHKTICPILFMYRYSSKSGIHFTKSSADPIFCSSGTIKKGWILHTHICTKPTHTYRNMPYKPDYQSRWNINLIWSIQHW